MNKIVFDTFENILQEIETGDLRAIGCSLVLKQKGLCIFHPHIVTSSGIVITRSYAVKDGKGSDYQEFYQPFTPFEYYTDGVIKLENVFIKKYRDAPFMLSFQEFYTSRFKLEDLYHAFDEANSDWRRICLDVYKNKQEEFK